MRAARTSAAVASGLLLAVVAAAPAAAVDDDDGMWYFTATGMDALHERTTGKGVQIAVIDTAIWPDAGDLAGTSVRVHEPSFCADGPMGKPLPAAQRTPDAAHGTNMTSLIVGTGKGEGGQPGIRGVAPDADVWFYSSLVGERPDGTQTCYSATVEGMRYSYGAAIDQAVVDGADIISISLSSRLPLDYGPVGRALNAGVVVVAALADEADHGYPWGYNGVVAVESLGPDVQARPGARPGADVVAPGEAIRHLDDDLSSYHPKNGSSAATAFTAGALALVWSAYPEATGNQIIQTLIRNTNAEDHELYHDPLTGYGIVNARHMLEHDPTTYPDENPLLDDDPDSIPSVEMLENPELLDEDITLRDSPRPETPGATATPSPDRTTTATQAPPSASGPDDADGGPGTPMLLAAGGGLLAVVVAAVAGLAARRRRTTTAHDGPPSPPSAAHESGSDPRDGGK